jgi:[ribosomal protein S5]-alanine N-acetyltransferase
MTFPTLITERLVLRELDTTDAADVLTFRGDPDVQRYDDPPLHSLREAIDFVGEMRRACASHDLHMWAITLKGEDQVVGLVTLQSPGHRGDSDHRRAEIGYGIARAAWGQGIGVEAVRAVVGYGFGQLRLNRIYAATIVDNHASVRLLETLGFVREGTQRRHSLEDDGQFHDSAIYGILHDEWDEAA